MRYTRAQKIAIGTVWGFGAVVCIAYSVVNHGADRLLDSVERFAERDEIQVARAYQALDEWAAEWDAREEKTRIEREKTRKALLNSLNQ
jgi:hypothetical protein